MPPKPASDPIDAPVADAPAVVDADAEQLPDAPPVAEAVTAVKVVEDCRVNFQGVLLELKRDQRIDNHPELVRYLSETGAPVLPA